MSSHVYVCTFIHSLFHSTAVCQEGCNPGGGTCDLPGECK